MWIAVDKSPSKNFRTLFDSKVRMAKTKSKPAVAAPEKKVGDGGRINKQTSAMERTKAAKSVVAAAKNPPPKAAAAPQAGSKLKGILKNAVVI